MKACICLLLFIAAFGICTASPAMAAPASDEVRITTTSADARADFIKAMALTTNLHTDEALQLLEHATTLDPAFAMAHYMLAVLAPTTESAMKHLATATGLTGNISDGERLLIEAHHAYRVGAMKQYEDLSRRVVEMHPDDAWARLVLGDLLRNTNRNEEAITEFEKILSIQPGYPPALNLLGYANMALGRYEAAETAFKRYVEVLPDEPNPLDSYAELLMKLGRYDESIRSYEKALALDKTFHSATIGIANNLILQGHPAAARLRFQTLYENAGTTAWKRAALSGLIRAFVSEGKYDRAIAEAKRRRDISMREKNALATASDLNLIGTLMLASGSVDPARGTYLKSRTADARRTNQIRATLHDAVRMLESAAVAEEVKTRVRLALLFTEIEAAVLDNDLVSAHRKVDEHRVIAARTGDPTVLQEASTLRAIIAVAERRYADALDDLQQADLTDARTLFRLMEVHEALGNATEARDVRRKILEVNDGSLHCAMVKRWVTE